jgi:hypothetical protein
LTTVKRLDLDDSWPAEHKAAFLELKAELQERRTKLDDAADVRAQRKSTAAATAAFASEKSATSPTNKRGGSSVFGSSTQAKRRKAYKQLGMEEFTSLVSTDQAGAANAAISTDQGRLFFGGNIPFSLADSPLWRQYAASLVHAGSIGMRLPSPAELAAPNFVKSHAHIALPSAKRTGGAVLDDQHRDYITRIRQKAFGYPGTKINGYTITSDGTKRFHKSTQNLCIYLPDEVSLPLLSAPPLNPSLISS